MSVRRIGFDDGNVRNPGDRERVREARQIKRMRLQDDDVCSMREIAGTAFAGSVRDLCGLQACRKIRSCDDIMNKLTVKLGSCGEFEGAGAPRQVAPEMQKAQNRSPRPIAVLLARGPCTGPACSGSDFRAPVVKAVSKPGSVHRHFRPPTATD